MRVVTIPAAYQTLDSVVATDGEFYNAFVRTVSARNINKLIGQGRRLVNDGFSILNEEFEIGSPGIWVPALEYDVLTTPGLLSASVALWAKVANTKSVYIQFGSSVLVPFMTADGTTIAGDGTWKRYPAAAGTFYSLPISPLGTDHLTMFVKGNDNGVLNDKFGQASGTYDDLFDYGTHIYLKCSAGFGFDTVVAALGSNAYIGIKNAGGDTDWRLPPARILRVLSATELFIAPGWDLVATGVPRASAGGAPVWQMRQCTTLLLANLSIYEAEPSGDEI